MTAVGLGVVASLLAAPGALAAPGPGQEPERGATPTAPAAAARVAPSVQLEGRGYGHGHGLSQNGAQGAATRGLTYRQIVRFYYPGLTFGRLGGSVAVLLTADTSRDVVVSARAGLKATGLGAGRPTFALQRRGATQWRITPSRGGAASTVSYLAGGRWRALRTVAGDAQLSAGGRPLTLHTPAGRVAYRGVLRSASPAGAAGDRDTVNVVPLDAYLKGVVPREVPALWKPHAVRAQAVAARTYAAYERAHPSARHYQFCDTSQCQVYGGYSAEHPASNAAIDATAGQVLLHRGQPAFTQFSASNGGHTLAGSQSYLPGKPDPYDTAHRGWRVTLSGASISASYPSIGTFRSLTVTKRNGDGAWGGRATTVRLTGSAGSTSISGDTFRSVFGLKSTWFRTV